MENIKETIQQKYGSIAADAGTHSGCCGSDHSCSGSSSTSCMTEEYSGDTAGAFAAANLGLGCGTPVEYAAINEGMTVLDLGSGAGIDAFIASKYVGGTGKVIGLDMTQAMVDRAADNARKFGVGNVEFLHGDIEEMPIATNSVDRIISNCVLNLVPDKSRAFSEIHRVLKPGGFFVVSDIVFTGNMDDGLRQNRELWAACVSGALDKKEYLAIIEQAGFSGIEIIRERAYDQLSTETYILQSITVKARK
ncbi:MAG TPA: arsenite methyltransferase [Bacteroidota bacterium]|nr:arsenite methyltransferase [Bacteroidota bacterium]